MTATPHEMRRRCSGASLQLLRLHAACIITITAIAAVVVVCCHVAVHLEGVGKRRDTRRVNPVPARPRAGPNGEDCEARPAGGRRSGA